jgi:pyruvate formate lyase activating enzyme
MNIGGFQEISLLDYPGKVATIIWTTGCNFRCPFCYNPDMVLNNTGHIPVDDFFSFLKQRKGKLDAVSISGGEPFLQPDLSKFITRVRDLGFFVKIDTNGSFPKKLKELLDADLIDYVSMDVKSSKDNYSDITKVSVNIDDIDQSIRIIKEDAPDYEFKTTVIPRYHTKEDILEIARWIQGAKRYFLQQFKKDTMLLSSELSQVRPYSVDELKAMCELVKPYVGACAIRGV